MSMGSTLANWLDPWMWNCQIQRANCTTSFCSLRTLTSSNFIIQTGSWNQSPEDTLGQTIVTAHRGPPISKRARLAKQIDKCLSKANKLISVGLHDLIIRNEMVSMFSEKNWNQLRNSFYYIGRLWSWETSAQRILMFYHQWWLLQFCDSSILAKLGKINKWRIFSMAENATAERNLWNHSFLLMIRKDNLY